MILTSVVIPDATGTGGQLRDWSHNLCGAPLAHRDGVGLVASTTALGMSTVDATAAARDVLAERVCPEPEAMATAFLHLILNHIMVEQTHTQLVSLGVLDAFDDGASRAGFSHGVELLVRGVTI